MNNTIRISNGGDSSLEQACKQIEANEIKELTIKQFVRVVELVLVCHANGQVLRYARCHFKNNFRLWRRLGEAVGHSTALQVLRTKIVRPIRTVEPSIAQSIGAFYQGAARNMSVKTFRLCPLPGDLVPMFELNYIAQNNPSLEDLIIRSPGDEMLSSDQSLAILEAVRRTSTLDTLWIGMLNGDSDIRIINHIVSACFRVEDLTVMVGGASLPYIGLAHLLRNNRATSLKEVTLYCDDGRLNRVTDSEIIEISNIATSLRTNTTLKKLHSDSFRCVNLASFGRILCDPTSIESIISSNHTLLELMGSGCCTTFVTDYTSNLTLLESCGYCCKFIQDCLHLNNCIKKHIVIRQKIARYYFKGNFDVSPFVDMSIKLLPDVIGNVIGMIEGDEKNRCSAIFRLLKNIPALSNVSDRFEEQNI